MIKLKIREKKTSDELTLTLLPTIEFTNRWTTVERRSTVYLLRQFTGTILKDRIHNFGGIYFDGNQKEGSNSLIDLRDAPEDCFEVTVINVVTIDWFLIDGNGIITSYLGQTTEYQNGEDRVCAPPGSTEVYRDQGTDTRTVAHIPTWKVNSFLNEYDHLLNSKDENFIEDNTWIIPFLEEFIEECGGNDPGRPDLGLVGNYIRKYVTFDESKEMFERYWLGQGDWTISTTKFQDIVSTLPSPSDWDYVETQGNQKIWLVDLDFKNDIYGMLGTFTLHTDLNDQPVGLYDYINFDWKFGTMIETIDRSGKSYDIFTLGGICGFNTGRKFKNEWVTRAVSIASLRSSADPYIFKYP